MFVKSHWPPSAYYSCTFVIDEFAMRLWWITTVYVYTPFGERVRPYTLYICVCGNFYRFSSAIFPASQDGSIWGFRTNNIAGNRRADRRS